MGKLSFSIEMVGGEEVEARLKRIAALQAGVESTAKSSASSSTRRVQDDTKALDAWYEKAMKSDALAKSILGGKWTFDMPITKMADESERLSKWLEKGATQFKGLDKLGQSILGGKWEFSSPSERSEREKQLAEWREKMKSIVPNVNIVGQGKSVAPEVLEAQEKVWSDASQAIAKRMEAMNLGGEPMGKSAEEREKSIKKEAMEARRLDQLKAAARSKELDHARFMKDMTFSMMPLMNPGSLWGTLFGARQTFSAFMTEAGQEKIGKFGLKGTSGAASAMGVWMAGLTAAGFAIKGFTTAIQFVSEEIKKSFQFAHQLYAKAILTGLPLQFTAQRQMASSVLGIPEQNLFFSRQSLTVMNQLKTASQQVAQSAPQLAYTSAQFKILEFKILGVASRIATDLTPSLNGLAKALGFLLDVFDRHSSFIINLTSKMVGASLTMANPNLGAIISQLGTGSKILSAIGNAGGGGTFGLPDTRMNQLKASSWEKMGLVIGGSFGDRALDYQRRTATTLEKILSNIQRNNQKSSGYYLNRNPFVTQY